MDFTLDNEVISLGEQEITPELAKEWLEKNSHNRKLSRDRINAMAKAMKNGDWKFTGDSIKFDSDGILVDGQHRLEAICQSGVSIHAIVIMGVDMDAQAYIDVGKRRTIGDALHIRGEKNPEKLGSALLYLHSWRQRGDFKGEAFRRAEDRPNHQELLKLLDQHPQLRDAVIDSAPAARKLGSGPLLATLFYIFRGIHKTDADFFMERLASGTGLTEEAPIYKLREAMVRSNIRKEYRFRPYEMAALIIKAWNAYRDGETIRQLSWRGGGANPERYPVPK